MPNRMFMKQIRSKYKDDLEIYGIINGNEPKIIHSEKMPVPVGSEEKYENIASYFKNGGNNKDGVNRNEPHAVLKDVDSFDESIIGEGMRVECYETDYAMCQLHREELGTEFPLITGNAIVYCEKSEELAVQIRGKNSHLFPGYFSIFGGGYLPVDFNDKTSDAGSIYRCINREFKEESGNDGILEREKCPLLVCKELSNYSISGSIQFNALAMKITPDNLERLFETWEGSIKRISINELKESLNNDKWVPFAKASIEIWLEMQREYFD